MLLVIFTLLSAFQTTDGVDIYTIEARQPIAFCLSACIWCGPPADVICSSGTPVTRGCESPAWTQCVGTGQTIQLAMSYSDGQGAVWVDFEDVAHDFGRPMQARLERAAIFADGFETGDTRRWTEPTSGSKAR